MIFHKKQYMMAESSRSMSTKSFKTAVPGKWYIKDIGTCSHKTAMFKTIKIYSYVKTAGWRLIPSIQLENKFCKAVCSGAVNPMIPYFADKDTQLKLKDNVWLIIISFSLTLTHTHSHTHSLSHTLTHSLTHTHTHTQQECSIGSCKTRISHCF